MKSNKWSSAATSGLLLALVSVAVLAIESVLSPGQAINLILSLTKLVASIWLVYYFIKEFARQYEIFSYANGFSYGFIVCLFSSFICVVAQLLIITVISPETFDAQIDTMINAFAQSRPDIAENLADMQQGGALPMIVAAASFVWYMILGTIVSAIMANFTKKVDNIF